MQQAMVDEWLVPLQQALGKNVFRSAWEAGRVMAVEQVLELALSATQTPPTEQDRPPDASRKPVTELSPREQQVAAVLAQGLTNRQIAEQLVVTQRTVASLIEHVREN